MVDVKRYTEDAVALLRELISTPSVSREEKAAADVLTRWMDAHSLSWHRENNNVWCLPQSFRQELPTVLLNAHIDTVRPVSSWLRDPFCPQMEDGILYGLGSNDCGGGLVSLLQVFRVFEERGAADKPSLYSAYNLVFLASAEEEVSGQNGIVKALPLLPKIDVAVVGEPTGMQPAVAEKGLMVLDMTAHGKSGHAARGEGVNAIYEMLDDLLWIRDYRFERVSPFLGATQMQATVVNAGTQHNVVPDECRAIIDVRTNECYTNEEVFQLISSHVRSEVKARSFRLSSSHIDVGHPLVQKCVEMGKQPFGSPTLSDQALMPFPSFKMGPGDSARSHSADEYIRVREISDAIETYIRLFQQT